MVKYMHIVKFTHNDYGEKGLDHEGQKKVFAPW